MGWVFILGGLDKKWVRPRKTLVAKRRIPIMLIAYIAGSKCLATNTALFHNFIDGSVCTGRATTKWPPIRIRVRVLPHSLRTTPFSRNYHVRPSIMDADSKEQKRRKVILSSLGAAIVVMDLAKELPSPAKPVFGPASALLKRIKVHFLFYDDGLQIHAYPGHHDQQNRLPRARVGLCRCM